MKISLEDRFLGCMYGLAIGDALGYPVEFMSKEYVEKILGPNGVTGFSSLRNPLIASNIQQQIGSYSDDTQMAIATARGIINSKTSEIDDLMESISKEYITWYKSPENNRAPGATCCAGVRNMIAGKHWKNSGVNGEGCGAAMRTAPIGLYCAQVPRKISQLATYASNCTHQNFNSIIAGKSAALLVNLALRDYTPEQIASLSENLYGTHDTEFNKKMAEANHYIKSNENPKIALAKLGRGWKGVEAVPMALYCFLKNPKDYQKTVLMATNIDGDSDSVACIAGAISGAYNGINAIPLEWINQIENKDLLRNISRSLLEKSLKLKED